MTLIKDLSLTDRFAYFVNGLCKVVAAQHRFGRLTGPTIVQTWNRLQRALARFTVLVAQFRAGTLPLVRPARVRATPVRPDGARPVRVRAPSVLPRGQGWLQRSSPEYWHINAWRAELEAILADPEMAMVLAVAPQLGRSLRPICHMLAIKPPPALALPPRVRKPRPKVVPEAHPEMWRWPHASFHARFGTKKQRKQRAEWEAYLAARKNDEGKG